MAFRVSKSLVFSVNAGAVVNIPMPGLISDVGNNGLALRTFDTMVVDASVGSNLSVTFDGTVPSAINAAVYLPAWVAGPQPPVSIPNGTQTLAVFNGSSGTIALFVHFGSSQARS